MSYIRRTLWIVLAWLCISSALADDVQFTASVSQSTVPLGQAFQLVYNINSRKVKEVRMPDLSGHFEVVAGPYTSHSSNTSIINGSISSSYSYMVTYTLIGRKEGTFNIPAGTATVNGTTYNSNAVKVKVIPADASPNMQNGGVQESNAATSQQFGKDDLFLLPIVSHTSVMEQEAVMITYKLYMRVDVVSIPDIQIPDFKGFVMNDMNVSESERNQLEHYKGRNYNTYILKRMLLFPQHSGRITIEPLKLNAMVRVLVPQQRQRSIFDSFFDSYQELKKSLSSGSVTINVKPLPTPKPADFCGGVGSFQLSVKADKTELKENEPISFNINLSGTGNLKYMKNPEIKLPADFEVYEPAVNNEFKAGENGMIGSKRIEYMAIPRHSGEFVVPGLKYSYYDLKAGAYRTLTTAPITLKVAKGDGTQSSVVANFADKEQVRALASDIRYIKTEGVTVKPRKALWTGSFSFWLSYLLPLAVMVLLTLFFRKQVRENADVALSRTKRAHKVACRRLKKAEEYLKKGDKVPFYDETLKVLWGYLCDKFSMPLSELNKDNVAAALQQHQVSQPDIDDFMKLLGACEFERFAPLTDSQAAMDKIYNTTVSMIMRLENTVKRSK